MDGYLFDAARDDVLGPLAPPELPRRFDGFYPGRVHRRALLVQYPLTDRTDTTAEALRVLSEPTHTEAEREAALFLLTHARSDAPKAAVLRLAAGDSLVARCTALRYMAAHLRRDRDCRPLLEQALWSDDEVVRAAVLPELAPEALPAALERMAAREPAAALYAAMLSAPRRLGRHLWARVAALAFGEPSAADWHLLAAAAGTRDFDRGLLSRAAEAVVARGANLAATMLVAGALGAAAAPSLVARLLERHDNAPAGLLLFETLGSQADEETSLAALSASARFFAPPPLHVAAQCACPPAASPRVHAAVVELVGTPPPASQEASFWRYQAVAANVGAVLRGGVELSEEALLEWAELCWQVLEHVSNPRVMADAVFSILECVARLQEPDLTLIDRPVDILFAEAPWAHYPTLPQCLKRTDVALGYVTALRHYSQFALFEVGRTEVLFAVLRTGSPAVQAEACELLGCDSLAPSPAAASSSSSSSLSGCVVG